MRQTALRSLAAFCLAPAVTAAIAYGIARLFAAIGGIQDTFIQEFFIFTVLAYLAALTLGVPAHFFLRRRGAGRLAPWLAAGAAIGLASEFLFVAVPVLLFKSPEHQVTVSLEAALGFSALALASGAVAGAVFWLIAVKAAEA
jgi:hypothetical protein